MTSWLTESLRWLRALQLDNVILELDAKTDRLLKPIYHSGSRDLSEFGTLQKGETRSEYLFSSCKTASQYDRRCFG